MRARRLWTAPHRLATALLGAVAMTASPCRASPVLTPAGVGGVSTAGTTFAGSQQVLVRAADGRLYLAYTKSMEGVNQLYVALSTDGGQSWSDYPQISAGPTRSSNPHLLANPDGKRLIVFWTKQIATDPDAAEAIEYAPTGIVGVGDVLPLADGYDEPPVEKEEEEEEEGPPRIRQIFLSRFDGESWSTQEQLTEGGYNGFPVAVYDSRGVLHLVWYGADGTYYQIVYTRLSGGTWSRPELVSLGYPDSIIPAIAVDTRDDLHVAWYKYAPVSRSYQIFYRRHDAAEDRWAEQIQLSTGLREAMNAAVAIAPDQTLHVLYDGDTDTDGRSSIYLRTRSEGVWSPQRRVGRVDLDAEMPTAGVDGRGRVVALYHSLADGQIHLSTASDWGLSTPLTKEGTNRSPSLSWRGAYTPSDPEYVWTVRDANPQATVGVNRIRYGVLDLVGAIP